MVKVTTFSKAVLGCGLLFAALILFSCKKMDIQDGKINDRQPVSDFFKLTPALPNEILRVANKLKELDKYSSMISGLIQKDGFAIWDKAEIIHLPSQNSSSKFAGRNASQGIDTIIYIPLVLENTDNVNSFIYAKLNGSIQLRLYRGREYANYGFGNIADSTDNAERLALQIMMLNKKVFGYTHFGLTDSRLFNNYTTSGIDTSHMERYLDLRDINNAAGRNSGHWETGTVTICTRPNLEPLEPTNQRAFNAISLRSSAAVNRWNCVTTVRYYFVASDDEPVDNNIFIYNEGSGGGNNSISNINGPIPCNPYPLLDNGLLPCEDGNFTGWTIKDEHGFLYSRIEELQEKLAQDRFALTPCDSTTLMPLMSYGSMYQKVAQHEVPQSVLERLDSLTTYGSSSIFLGDYFNIQALEDAAGAVVNCDFFPIKISQMPLMSNGLPFTPKDLLEYFRLYKNNFISPSIGISFEPYRYNGFNDSFRFKAPFEQSIGAILHIHMTEDGSIVQTGYTNHTNPITNYQEHSFIYTTLSTGLDLVHPVSGNREFGIYSDQNNPNSYIFYTMGVDRINNMLYDIIDYIREETTGNSGFKEADTLWTNIQQNMINFINAHGGQASLYSNKNTIARPYWADVKDYLKGNINFEQLSIRLGC